MEYFCGTDIIEVSRIKDAILNTNGFKEKIYSEFEIEVANSKSEKSMFEYYAGRFAAKEAIYKAISSIKSDFNFWESEIVNDKNNRNRPVVNFKNEELRRLQNDKKLFVDVTISHITDYATATAIVKVS